MWSAVMWLVNMGMTTDTHPHVSFPVFWVIVKLRFTIAHGHNVFSQHNYMTLNMNLVYTIL